MQGESANPTWSDQARTSVRAHQGRTARPGRGRGTAEEIAARTVNKERARNGEAVEPSRSSIEDISSGRSGWPALAHAARGGRTYRQLYAEAQRRGIDGRSKMSKAQLERVLDR